MNELVDPVACVQAIVDRVYSPYTGPAWRPQAFPSRCRRYLWSDAFGVCNYLSLFYATANTQYRDQADKLITDVHDDLGCFRNSSQRLPNASVTAPTRGGLRIGKEDETDDGQYFHYLTKWMFALNRAARAHGTFQYNEWAVDLARVAHAQFVVRDPKKRAQRMVWKKSVDLERVLVASEGNLDPMDALMTYQLVQHASEDPRNTLKDEIADMQLLVDRKMPRFATHDALDSGEALWVSQWRRRDKWAQQLEAVALASMEQLFRSGRFAAPAGYRLMFREMGTVLGLEVALAYMTQEDERETWRARVAKLLRFWSDKVYERDADITPLMYAAARLPGVWRPEGGGEVTGRDSNSNAP